jgi:7-cyano-7-deazaguanine synthase
MRAVAIVSGGMDSVTLAYMMNRQGYDLNLVSFNYGQRHKKELNYAQLAAKRLGAKHTLVDLSALGGLLGGSALTQSDIDVPEGHYASDNMALTVVPNRNAIMLSIALGIAHATDADCVATAVHAGDHAVYWDCRPDFIEAMDRVARLAIPDGYGHASVCAPFVELTKAQIVRQGSLLGVPFAETWSCYKGETVHCGQCGTCVERIEAFRLAGIPDPTTYASWATYNRLHEEGTVA